MTSVLSEMGKLSDEIALALEYAPRDLSAQFTALFQFDARLGTAVAAAKEPQLARIRLAWWRDEIVLSGGAARSVSDPVLGSITTLIRRRDVTLEHMIRVVEGWAELLESLPLEPETLSLYAQGRGNGLFAAASATVGVSVPDEQGQAFALVDFARNCSDAVSRERALILASGLAADPLPRALRPFALVDDWARRNAMRLLRGVPPLSQRRLAFSALTFALSRPRL